MFLKIAGARSAGAIWYHRGQKIFCPQHLVTIRRQLAGTEEIIEIIIITRRNGKLKKSETQVRAEVREEKPGKWI